MAEFKEEAVKWIDGVNDADGIAAGWRLEILSKKFRKPRKGETEAREVPFRIRRFVRGLPWALVHDAIKYLISLAPYKGIIYNGVPIEGTYRPTLTRWSRDDAERVNGNAFGSYTLVQDLIEDDFIDEYDAVTSGSCTEEVVTTWRWDEPGIEDITAFGDFGAQGITYAIQAVRRNEDDTFEYAIVKRIAKTQHTGPVVTECNELSTTTVETWDNVYGDETEGFRDDTGAAIPGIPPPCTDEPGVTVQFSVRKNQDCTYQIQLVRKETFEDTVEWEDGSTCQPRKVTVVTNSKEKPLVPRAEPGETVDANISRNPDMSYNARIAVQKGQEEETIEWTDGSLCKERNVVQIINSPVKPAIPKPAPGQTLNVSLRKNTDCTYSAEFSVVETPDPAVITWTDGSRCRARNVTSYQNAREKPSVPEAGEGQTVNATIRQNDDCTYDAQISVTEPAPDAVIEWDDGTQCRPRHVTSYQNQKTQPDVPAPGEGQTVNATIRQNDDCTYDAQISVTEPAPVFDETFTEGTVYSKADTRVFQNLKTLPGFPVPEVGKIVRISVRQNDDCTYSGSISTSTPEEVSVTWESGSECHTIEEARVLNTTKAPEAVIPEPGEGEYIQASVAPKDDGTFDISYTKESDPQFDTGWLTWPSVTVTARNRSVYTHGYRAVGGYKTAQEVLALLTPPGEHNTDISVNYNPRTCTYGGTARYQDLEEYDEDGGKADGGSKSGKLKIVSYQEAPGNMVNTSGALQQYKLTRTYEVVRYHGNGNEGDEAQEAVNGLILDGVRLGPRMYVRRLDEETYELVSIPKTLKAEDKK